MQWVVTRLALLSAGNMAYQGAKSDRDTAMQHTGRLERISWSLELEIVQG